MGKFLYENRDGRYRIDAVGIDGWIELARKARNPGFVYVLRCKGTDYYKIGVSSRLMKRIKDIQRTVPFDIEVIDYAFSQFPYGCEEFIHWTFATLRANGEWFCMPPSAINVLDQYMEFIKENEGLVLGEF